jgi:flagellar motility protein MotE (MotC chaperone)
MKKIMSMMRVLSLLFFCAAIFALSYGAVWLKNHFAKKDGAATEAAATEGKGEVKDDEKVVKAAVDVDGTADAPAAKVTVDPAAREKALNSGRALFAVPGPYSIPQITALMDELEHARGDYKERATSLDLRERQLDAFSHELEQKRIEILNLAKTVTPAPSAASGGKSEVLDTKTVTALAKIFANMQPQAAANALNGYTADRSAQILMAMKDDKIGEILSQMGSDGLKRITDAIARVNSNKEEDAGH